MGKNKIIPLLMETGADTYINPIGGATSSRKRLSDSGKSLNSSSQTLCAEVMAAHSLPHASILHFILHHTPEELSLLAGKGSLVMGR